MKELQRNLINDPATARWFQLLNVLESGQIVTAACLAKKIKVSQRTILTDIHGLKKHFGEFVRFTSSNTGYSFQVLDPLGYHKRKQALLTNEPVYEIIGNIFYGEMENVTDTAEYLNYSPGSLRRILTSIQPVLRPYGLKLHTSPINLVGDESSIRKFFLDFYYEGYQNTQDLHHPKGFQERLFELLDQFYAQSELISDVSCTYFYYTIYITIERYRQGHSVSLPAVLIKQLYKELDFHRLYDLIKDLGKTYTFHLPKKEVAWIYYILLTKRSIHKPECEDLFYARFGLWPEIDTLSRLFIDTGDYDDWDQAQLLTFIKSFFLAKKINDLICPTLNRVMADTVISIKEKHTKLFKRHRSFLEKKESKLCFSTFLLEDIAVSLTMFCHLLTIYYLPRKKVCFLLEGEHMTTLTIKAQAIQWLGANHDLIFLPIWSLSSEALAKQKIDLIITNYEPYVSKYLNQYPHILTSSPFHLHDWKKIFHALSNSWLHVIHS